MGILLTDDNIDVDTEYPSLWLRLYNRLIVINFHLGGLYTTTFFIRLSFLSMCSFVISVFTIWSRFQSFTCAMCDVLFSPLCFYLCYVTVYAYDLCMYICITIYIYIYIYIYYFVLCDIYVCLAMYCFYMFVNCSVYKIWSGLKSSKELMFYGVCLYMYASYIKTTLLYSTILYNIIFEDAKGIIRVPNIKSGRYSISVRNGPKWIKIIISSNIILYP